VTSKRIAIAILLTGVVSVAGCATAVLGTDRLSFSDAQMTSGTAIDDHDRALIERWYNRHGGQPGAGALPPGLVKMDTLSPDLKGSPLPRALEARLSRLADGYVRRVIGHAIVLIRRHDRRVMDLYRDAVP
jgi:hypothetical protein